MGATWLPTRYYDPETARFINADAYVSTGQGVLGNNMYLYCGNNPVVRADDEGDFWNIVVGAVVGAALGALVQIGSNLLAGEHWLDGVGTAALTGGGKRRAGCLRGWAGSIRCWQCCDLDGGECNKSSD